MKALSFILLLFVSGALFAQQAAPVGIQLYSFREQFKTDVPGTLAKIKAMGFREVETAGNYGMSYAELRKLLDQYGLKVIGTSADYTDLEKRVPAIIEQAKTLGAKYVTCFWIPHNGDIFTKQDADRAVETFNTAGRLLRDNGLSLCYHLHGYEFQKFGESSYFNYFIEQFDPRYVNFEMDVYWIKHPGQDPVTLLQNYPKRFPLVHLKDRKPGTPGNVIGRTDVETNVVLGQGDVGIADIMKTARKAGVKHFFIEDESSRSLEQVPQSVAYLRTLK